MTFGKTPNRKMVDIKAGQEELCLPKATMQPMRLYETPRLTLAHVISGEQMIASHGYLMAAQRTEATNRTVL